MKPMIAWAIGSGFCGNDGLPVGWIVDQYGRKQIPPLFPTRRAARDAIKYLDVPDAINPRPVKVKVEVVG